MKLATSHCTNSKEVHLEWKHREDVKGHTRESVQSPLVVLKAKCLELKVRKGGDFFYGKSSNENYPEGL